LGIGYWGLWFGDSGSGIAPNHQSPIPNPQSPIPILLITSKLKYCFNILDKIYFFINFKESG